MNCCWASKQPIKQLNGHPESDHSGADRLDSLSVTRCQVVSAQDVRTRRLGQSGSVKEQVKQDLMGASSREFMRSFTISSTAGTNKNCNNRSTLHDAA